MREEWPHFGEEGRQSEDEEEEQREQELAGPCQQAPWMIAYLDGVFSPRKPGKGQVEQAVS